ncbi:hypothetical protein [Streptomyces marispadix]|uniref:Secreted protein n=1 Tax=Streptomyces marispadix TaxID=2922868 RepID=A0ABS9T0U8_9ACTN|nr:hypothetical protein [Streptomyces marispadix]MCH6162153.1 hypothetical protein [Streptomyces marispadix]
MSRSVRRGGIVAAAACGLLALSAGSASAAQPPKATAARGTAFDVTHVTDVEHVTSDVTADATDAAKSGHAAAERTLDDAGAAAPRSVERRLTRSLTDVSRKAQQTGPDVRDGAGKASRNVTQEAGEAVSEASSASTDTYLGALSRIPAQAAPSSAPGLPEDLVIEIPEVVPGVPSIGIIPLSLPALPVTPGIPSL